jgi:hypothetical protein
VRIQKINSFFFSSSDEQAGENVVWHERGRRRERGERGSGRRELPLLPLLLLLLPLLSFPLSLSFPFSCRASLLGQKGLRELRRDQVLAG